MEIQWSLILFTALTGAAGWGFATLALQEVRGKSGKSGFSVALVLLVVLLVGGCASVTHLSHPENILGALSHPTSGIFVEAVLVGLTALAALVYLVVKKREGAQGAVKGFAVIAGALGIVLSFMAGESYVVASQPAWNTPLMPLAYCLTAAPAGVALCWLVFALAQKSAGEDSKALGNVLGIVGLLGAVSAIAWGAASGHIAEIGGGIGLAVAGSLVAALMGFIARSGKNVIALTAIALVCALVGAIGLRYGMWAVGFGINNFFGSV